MKITKNNFNEQIQLIADALLKSDYNKECFSKSELELNNIVWKEFENICNELIKSNVNFTKFVLPILVANNIEVNEEKINQVKEINQLEYLPDDLFIEIECPYLDNLEKW